MLKRIKYIKSDIKVICFFLSFIGINFLIIYVGGNKEIKNNN